MQFALVWSDVAGFADSNSVTAGGMATAYLAQPFRKARRASRSEVPDTSQPPQLLFSWFSAIKRNVFEALTATEDGKYTRVNCQGIPSIATAGYLAGGPIVQSSLNLNWARIAAIVPHGDRRHV